MGRRAEDSESLVGENGDLGDGNQSTAGHEKPRGKQGGPPSKAKHRYRPIAHSTMRER